MPLTRRRKIVLTALVGGHLLLWSSMGHSAEPVRDPGYFQNHPAERLATLRVCRHNPSYTDTPTCRSALQADYAAYERELRRSTERAANERLSPQYWQGNPVGLRTAQAICQSALGVRSAYQASYCNTAGQALSLFPPDRR